MTATCGDPTEAEKTRSSLEESIERAVMLALGKDGGRGGERNSQSFSRFSPVSAASWRSTRDRLILRLRMRDTRWHTASAVPVTEADYERTSQRLVEG